MFGLMRNPIKDNPPPTEGVAFTELHAGCVVGFGFMPQKAISGRRMPVVQVNSYLFDDDSFIAYRLESDDVDVNLIVADEGDPIGPYLALSQRIEPHLFPLVFPAHPPEQWFAFAEGKNVEARPVVLGMPPGWITSAYTLAVSTSGRIMEGDYRLCMPADRTRLSRPFDYVLLVDEENEYALEAEKYEDGTMNVFATVYRPATDIGEITRAPKSPLASVEIIPHVAPTESAKSTELEPGPEASLKEPASASLAQSAEASPFADMQKSPEENPPDENSTRRTPEEAISAAEIKTYRSVADSLAVMTLPDVEVKEVDARKEVDVAPVHSKFERIQPANDEQQGTAAADTLACDLPLAWRLIDEARRNQMLLSELVRKVIDLPARVREEVLIPFALDNAELIELARRYNLSVADTEGVKKQIIEELQRFVGEKK